MEMPRVLVLGATGRIGGLLRRRWGEGAAEWGTRALFADPPALAGAARGADAILCLSGVTPPAAAPYHPPTSTAGPPAASCRAISSVG